MKISSVNKASFLKEVIRTGGILKGRILKISGNKVIIDFGDFIGEALWEASDPVPQAGETLIFAVKEAKNPLILKVIKPLKAAKLVSIEPLEESVEIFSRELEEEETKKQISELIRILHKVSAKKVEEKVHSSEEKSEKTPSFIFSFSIPVKIDEKNEKLKLLINSQEENEVFMVSLFATVGSLGNFRIDMYYVPRAGKRLIVNLQASTKEGADLAKSKKEILEQNLKSLGFSPYVRVTYNPKIKDIFVPETKAFLLEKRV